MAGEKLGNLEVSDNLFGVKYNGDLLHQAISMVAEVTSRQAGQAKTRGEVSMTTQKWFRQKGLGRARHGARSAPQFVGGGKAFGPRRDPITNPVRMPKKMRAKAIAVAMSQQLRDGRVRALDGIDIPEIRTKVAVEALHALHSYGKRTLLLLGDSEAQNDTVYYSCRNIDKLVAREVPHFNARDIVWAESIIITRAALEQMGGGVTESA
jgi:large subunit ribosomal protein L4